MKIPLGNAPKRQQTEGPVYLAFQNCALERLLFDQKLCQISENRNKALHLFPLSSFSFTHFKGYFPKKSSLEILRLFARSRVASQKASQTKTTSNEFMTKWVQCQQHTPQSQRGRGRLSRSHRRLVWPTLKKCFYTCFFLSSICKLVFFFVEVPKSEMKRKLRRKKLLRQC